MNSKFSLLLLFSVFSSLYEAQTTVYAYLKDEEGKPVERAEVDLKGSDNDVTADKIGYFQFVDMKPGHYQIVIAKPNYETKVFDFDVVAEQKTKDLGVITLYSTLNGAEQGLTIIDNIGSEENEGQSSTVGLLQSSRDVFSNLAAYDLGPYWFRPRGIDGRKSNIMLNGVSMTNADDGNIDFGNWGGLNEIVRYPIIATNHAPSEYDFGGVGSVVYKNTLASEYRKGSQLTYSLTNRNYRHRLSYRYTSGMNRKGWAYTIMGARRWAKEGIQEGTNYDAYGAYVGIEKKINDKHTVALNFIGAPYMRSTASPNTAEVYALRGEKYNSYWGWQGGEKRNERVKKGFQPIIQLTDYWKINNKSQLWTTISYQFGKDKASRLDWRNVQSPSPTYYRYLPSYWANMENPYPEKVTEYENLWKSGDPAFIQINWEALYAANRNSKEAAYFLVNDVNDDKIWNLGTHFVHHFNDNTKFLLNVSYQNYQSEQYREVKDLMEAEYMLDTDKFNKDSESGSFNVNDPESHKVVGDKINYDYIFRRQQVKFNPGLKFSSIAFDVFVSGLVGYNVSNREGLFQHYKFAEGFGKSDNREFWNTGLKGQVTYKVDGRNFIVYNGAYYTEAPYMDELFANARVSNQLTPRIQNALVNANDISYILNSPIVRFRATAYLIDTKNETNITRYFADVALKNVNEEGQIENISGAFVTEIMPNVDKRNMGIEAATEVKITPSLAASGLVSLGKYTYENNPNVYFFTDAVSKYESGLPYADYGTSYLKGYRQGRTPQEAYTLGLKYSSPKYWWLGVTWNYLAHSYLDPSPVLRTESFIQDPVSSVPYPGVTEEELRRVLAQKQLPKASFVNLNAGKSWLIGKYYVMITASVNNVLNNKDFITGGFEQGRNANYDAFVKDFDSEKPVFSPKYWPGLGTQYFINFQLRF